MTRGQCPDATAIRPGRAEASGPVRVVMPHPIPYQGSKRLLAPHILAYVAGQSFGCLYEPFAGSAALTIAAAHRGLAERFALNDSLAPLVESWRQIMWSPELLAEAYEQLWRGQIGADATYYTRVRRAFNRSQDAAQLLYLLARCVKNAPRFNQRGAFNQSADHRRLGTRPPTMRHDIMAASALLRRRATVTCGDFEAAIASATSDDLVYLDPPYQGASTGADRRYHQGLSRERLIGALRDLNRRGVPFLLSYDGRCGVKTYGSHLPESLEATHIELNAGRSTQATLHGRSEVTIESLYVSRALAQRSPVNLQDAAQGAGALLV